MTSTLLPSLQEASGALDRPFFPADRRRQALLRFAGMGFPATRLESWRHTDVSAWASKAFVPGRLAPVPGGLAERFAIPGAAVRLVFVNGFFAPALSDIAHLPEGVEAGPLALRPAPPAALGSLAALEDAPFAALNTALFPDGAYVRATRGALSEVPVHLLFLTVPDSGARLIAPRVLVVLEENAQVLVAETHAGGAEDHLSAAVTELDLGPNARLTHVRRVLELGAGAHLARIHARQARGSVYLSHNVVFGGALVRNELSVVQEGEGAECSLDGVALARGRDLVDNHTTVDHAAPHGTSRESYKYLVADRARGVFNGEVVIRPGAQKADASQSNGNLLLSDQALVHTKPELRIFADDVKAKHGATVGQLNKDLLFYCRSRGLSEADARRLLTQAFAVEVLARIPHEPLRESVMSDVGAWWEKPS